MFFSQFPDLLDYCDSLPGLLSILGDFDFHLDQPQNPNTSKFLDLLRMHSLRQLLDQSMHKKGHTVDLVIERPDDGIHQSNEVCDTLESNHMCVITQLNVTVIPHAPVLCTEYSATCAPSIELPSTKIFRQNWATSQTSMT